MLISKSRMLRTLYFLIVAALIPRIHAAMVDPIQQPDGTLQLTSPSEFIATIIKYAIGIAGILGVIGITWGGIQMILSVGEEEKQKKAKFMMIYSVLWVIIAGLAYSIVTILSSVKL